ncbi:MAG: hypothetical protein CVV53_08495 [Spirochaetae bacterium HGW-Spirochaetae-9]|nr:MAG: hypothetical protein CVV53_08495 [Spirochaetae bacterium HGW-Spirochaetae-9]
MRKARFLVGSIASLVKPLFLGSIAVGVGLSDSGGFASSFLRYLIFPQLLPALCLFFLFLDEKKYGPFKPLVAVFEIGSLLFLALSLLSAAQNPQKLMVSTASFQGLSGTVVAFFIAFVIDIFCGATLIPGGATAPSRIPPIPGAGGDVTAETKEL